MLVGLNIRRNHRKVGESTRSIKRIKRRGREVEVDMRLRMENIGVDRYST